MYKIEIEQIKTKVGWFYRDEFFETDE